MQRLLKSNLRKAASATVGNHADLRRITLSELFCGAGGLALGAYWAEYKGYSFEHKWATDYDKNACETFRKNFPKTEVICQDITTFDFKKMPKTDGLVFGFPCNDFSSVGEQKGINGSFGGLYKYCLQALKILQPAFFVAENVGGLRNLNDNKDYAQILKELKDCGYDVFPRYYKFEEYGIPQSRHRIIIIGFHSSAGIAFSHVPPLNNKKHQSAEEALKNIPRDAPNNELTKQSEIVVERLKYIKPGENAFTAKLPDRLKLNVKKATMSMIYRRLDPKKPSYTITGSGGGGTHVYHWEENRALTNRERARLQTFPDAFIFYGGKESVRKQIGMAVPPKGAKIIFRSILEAVDKVDLYEKAINEQII